MSKNTCATKPHKWVYMWGATASALSLLVVAPGCVVRFANAERQVVPGLKRIYIPAPTDQTTGAGQAAPVARALRRQLGLDTRFQLSSLEQAAVAIDLGIVQSATAVTRMASCVKGTGSLASGSVDCSSIGFHQSRVSSEEESLALTVSVRVVALPSGRPFFTKHYPLWAPYPVVGDPDTQNLLKPYPQLHALRYLENRDSAVSQLGEQVAGLIKSDLLGLSPPPNE